MHTPARATARCRRALSLPRQSSSGLGIEIVGSRVYPPGECHAYPSFVGCDARRVTTCGRPFLLRPRDSFLETDGSRHSALVAKGRPRSLAARGRDATSQLRMSQTLRMSGPHAARAGEGLAIVSIASSRTSAPSSPSKPEGKRLDPVAAVLGTGVTQLSFSQAAQRSLMDPRVAHAGRLNTSAGASLAIVTHQASLTDAPSSALGGETIFPVGSGFGASTTSQSSASKVPREPPAKPHAAHAGAPAEAHPARAGASELEVVHTHVFAAQATHAAASGASVAHSGASEGQVARCCASDTFTITVNTLAGDELAVQAFHTDTVEQLLERVASHLNTTAFSLQLAKADGVMLTGNATLGQNGIFEDVQLILVISDDDEYMKMNLFDFMQLVVSKNLDTREVVLEKQRRLADQFRQVYIPRLRAKRRQEEWQWDFAASTQAQLDAAIAEHGLEAGLQKAIDMAAVAEASAREAMEEVRVARDDCCRDLDVALAPLHDAFRALTRLGECDAAEVTACATPPACLQLAGEAMCILLKEKPSWPNAKGILSDLSRLPRRLTEYDKDNIPPGVIKRLQPYLLRPEFDPAPMEQVSRVASAVCAWARAVEVYHRVVLVVASKRERLMLLEDAAQGASWPASFLADVIESLRARLANGETSAAGTEA